MSDRQRHGAGRPQPPVAEGGARRAPWTWPQLSRLSCSEGSDAEWGCPCIWWLWIQRHLQLGSGQAPGAGCCLSSSHLSPLIGFRLRRTPCSYTVLPTRCTQPSAFWRRVEDEPKELETTCS